MTDPSTLRLLPNLTHKDMMDAIRMGNGSAAEKKFFPAFREIVQSLFPGIERFLGPGLSLTEANIIAAIPTFQEFHTEFNSFGLVLHMQQRIALT